jgi:Zn-dependent peptidase ImmA (M78 family)
MNLIKPSDEVNIGDSIQFVRSCAGATENNSGIIPLYHIVQSFPISIWLKEVENLSYQRAAMVLAARIGQIPDTQLGGDEPLSGFMYANRFGNAYFGCILVEKHDSIVRRRFSVAHELGHYVLHLLPVLQEISETPMEDGLVMTEGLLYQQKEDGSEDLPSNGGNLPVIAGVEIAGQMILIADPAKEAEANQFAAELLMPEAAIREQVEQFRPPGSRLSIKRNFLAKRLASEFLVSSEAMNYRLTRLNI